MLMRIDSAQRNFPENFIYLMIFTLLESFFFAAILSQKNMAVIVQALVLTTLIVMGLVIFTFQTKFDYNIDVGVIFTLFGVLLGLPIIGVSYCLLIICYR